MRTFWQWILDLFEYLGIGGGGGNGGMSRQEAAMEVTEFYREILGRAPEGEEADYHIMALVAGTMTLNDVEMEIRGSQENRTITEVLVRALYVELLFRDPGPKPGETKWRDEGALPYVEQIQWGHKTQAEILARIKESDEYKKKHPEPGDVLPARPFRVAGSHLFEPSRDRRYMPLSISLFYGLSTGISWERFQAVIDGLAGKVQEARLSMSTFTWGNDQGEPEVIPFKKGDKHEGYSNRISQTFLDVMEARLVYMIEKGIRPQVTMFWGGVKPLFRQGDGVDWDAMKAFMRPCMEMGQRHPEVKWEIINEAGHGHHWAYMKYSDRYETIWRCARFCRKVYPQAHLGVSDGGHTPREWISDHRHVDVVESKEYGGLVLSDKGQVLMDGDKPRRPEKNIDGAWFDYHGIPELSDWKVHFPRETLSVEGIPRWSRSMWHLNGEAFSFAKRHDGKGYGQNDENIFLQTDEEHRQWPYHNATTDWKMVVSSWYVALCAKSCSTAHTHKGFFCRPGAGDDPAITFGGPAYQAALKDFDFRHMASLNTGWRDSPIRKFDGPFKAFCLVGGASRSTMLFTVLNPKQGKLKLRLTRRYRVEAREITGEIRKTSELSPGEHWYQIPRMETQHTAIIRLTALA